MDMREVLEAMRINGLHDEAAVVGIFMQQRADLLEALNPFANGNWTKELALAAKSAITRAEAAE